LVAKTVPSLGTETVLIVSAFAEPLAEAGTEDARVPTARVVAAKIPALTIKAALVVRVVAPAPLARKRPVRNPMS
jgi:hypothetical protein